MAKKATAKKATAKKATAKKAAPKKATAKKATAKKATAKATAKAATTTTTAKAAKPKAKRKPNAAFMAPLTPSAILAQVVGPEARPRTEFVKRIWDYIKKNGLQDAKNRRNINADSKLKQIFDGKAVVSMFELTKFVSKHLK